MLHVHRFKVLYVIVHSSEKSFTGLLKNHLPEENPCVFTVCLISVYLLKYPRIHPSGRETNYQIYFYFAIIQYFCEWGRVKVGRNCIKMSRPVSVFYLRSSRIECFGGYVLCLKLFGGSVKCILDIVGL